MKSKREKIEFKDASALPKDITMKREAVKMFGKETVRHYPATSFDKLWLSVQFPTLFNGKDYLTQGEADRIIPMFLEKKVAVNLV
jgi:hypothetical protein